MNDIAVAVGHKIRNFRNAKKWTIRQLAEQIHKSKATVSKYESGEIIMDLVTFYEISRVLNINPIQLLADTQQNNSFPNEQAVMQCPPFFAVPKLYSYVYDGRNNTLLRCVWEFSPASGDKRSRAVLYMNIKDYERYQICENTYSGYIEHHSVISNIIVKNLATPVEQLTVSILADFMETTEKWGLQYGISFRPFMPIASKMLFSQAPLKENDELIDRLKISKEDIRKLKMYNMFSVTPDW